MATFQRMTALVAVLFLVGTAFGQGLTITGGKVVKVDRVVTIQEDLTLVERVPFSIQAPPGAFDYRWKYPATVTTKDDDSEILEITAAPKGMLTVSCRVTTVKVEGGQVVASRKTLSVTFAVGDVGPNPPLPVVPVGFRVLLVHEAQEKSPAFFDGRAVKLYLDAKTVKDGTQPSWRRIDKDATGANLPTDLRLLWEAAKPKLTGYPAVVIAVNTQVTIHPLPADEAGLIALLKSKGGE